MRARLTLAAILAVVVPLMPSSQTAPRSRAEQTNFEETSRYADVTTFIAGLAAGTGQVRVEQFGSSEEGRALPLLVIGDPPATAPAAAGQRTRPVVLVFANIHAGEVEGKEAVLHLARRLTTGDLQPLLGAATWLFVPIYNADGNERISVDNRPEQYGPIGGVGTRENANGLDLNRDFMKLDSAEARALVGVMSRWDPDVVVDLHTTNGSYHGYHLTYAPALHPNTDSAIAAFTRDRLLPAVGEAVAARRGVRTFYYGNFATRPALNDELPQFAPDDRRPKVWRTFDPRPRFGTNYVGLRNRVAILSEAYSYLDFGGRVRATEAFVEEIMRFVAAERDAILALSREADRRTIDGVTAAGVAFELRESEPAAEILVGAVRQVPHPRSGKPMTAMVENVATPTRMAHYGVFAATQTRAVPREYIVVPGAGVTELVFKKLSEHGIASQVTTTASRRTVDQFIVQQSAQAERAFQGHRERSISGRFERGEVEIPAGSVLVTTRQPLGRLVFYLLEPESDDGLTTWNFMDAALAVGQRHPVLKAY